MKTLYILILSIAFMLVPCSLFAQLNGYLGTKVQRYSDIDYSVYEDGNRKHIENSLNTLLSFPPYKIGSNPISYYSYANGLCHSGSVDMNEIGNIVRTIFSGLEIERYSNCPGFLNVYMAADPGTGNVLEVSFSIYGNKDLEDNTIFAIPLNKIYSLETLLKERIICILPIEAQDEMPSYIPVMCTLFMDDNM